MRRLKIIIFTMLFSLLIQLCYSQYEVNIESGVSLTVMPKTCVTINGDIHNSGVFNLKSAQQGDASLISTGEIMGGGIYNIERYLSANMWHLISASITSATAGIFQDLWLRPYNEAENSFGAYIVPINTPMPVGQGFSVWTNNLDEIRTFTGTINHGALGDFPLQLTGSPGIATGWNLIGNPYPSAIDWNNPSWIKTNLGSTIYLWNQSNYATWNGITGTNQGSRYIAMGQGFFVQAASTNAYIGLNNNIRVHNDIEFRNNCDETDLIRVLVKGNNHSDETVIYLVNEADNQYDLIFDAAKLYGSPDAPQLYTIKQDNKLAINAINSISFLESKKIFFEAGVHSNYTISFSGGMTEIDNIFIKDLFTNNIFHEGEIYTFESSPGDNPERFEFLTVITEIEGEKVGSNISAWVYDNILYVNLPDEIKLKEIRIFSILGEITMTSTNNITYLNQLTRGIYLVEINTNNNREIRKIVVQ